MNKGRQCSLRPETWRENWWMFWFSKDNKIHEIKLAWIDEKNKFITEIAPNTVPR